MRRSRDRRGRKNADRREADQGTNGGSRSQEKGTRRTVQAADGPPCGAPERDSRCTAVEPYRCKASRKQRRRRDETMKKLTLTVLAVWFAAALQPFANAQFGSGIVFDPTQSGHAIVQIEHEEQSISNQFQQIEQGTKIFTNTVKIATTALQTYNTVQQQYNLYRQMMNSPQMLYSRFLSPRSDLMLMQQVSNT